jgi:hypothetical protein
MYGTAEISYNTTFVSELSADGSGWKIDNNNFIDAIYVRHNNACEWVKGKFNVTDASTTRDYILKNTFELDPAK